jgi:hypothetical protein
MPDYERKNFSEAKEVRRFDHGSVELLNIAEGTVGGMFCNPVGSG